MGYHSPNLMCYGPGGSGQCRSMSPVTHIRETDHGNYKSFSLECATCATKQFPQRGIERLPAARRLTPEELANHQRNQREGYEYEYGDHEWDD